MDQQLVHKYQLDLSKAEYPVAELVTKGCSVEEIADKLCKSPHTIRNHKAKICQKWGARNSVDIARKFILSMDDPKSFFSMVLLLSLQVSLMTNCLEMDLRTSTRTPVKTIRTSRKYDS